MTKHTHTHTHIKKTVFITTFPSFSPSFLPPKPTFFSPLLFLLILPLFPFSILLHSFFSSLPKFSFIHSIFTSIFSLSHSTFSLRSSSLLSIKTHYNPFCVKKIEPLRFKLYHAKEDWIEGRYCMFGKKLVQKRRGNKGFCFGLGWVGLGCFIYL